MNSAEENLQRLINQSNMGSLGTGLGNILGTGSLWPVQPTKDKRTNRQVLEDKVSHNKKMIEMYYDNIEALVKENEEIADSIGELNNHPMLEKLYDFIQRFR